MTGVSLERAARWAPRVVALAAFALYALAAPPGVYWLDSGELSAAGIGLGISHPTGFPLYMLLVKAASLLPFGELAYRVNLLSAGCAALAVLWVARLVLDASSMRPAGRPDGALEPGIAGIAGAVAGGGILAVTLVFFRQATVAEVYAPTAALLALALLHGQRVAAGGGARAGLLLALICGLGLGVHVTFALVGLPVLALYLLRLRRGARWTLAAPLLVALVAGALYLYLPARAVAGVQPEIQWEQTDRAGGLIDHMSGARIRGAFADEMGARWTTHARSYLGEMGDQLLLALVAAAGGLLWLARRRRTRWLAAALAAIAVVDALYSTGINPMGQIDLQNGVPLALATCAAAGVGVTWLGRALGRAGPWAAGAAAIMIAIPAAMVSWSEVWAASSGDLPRRFAEAGLAAAPTGGVALVESDSLAAGAVYLATVESARPDLAIVVRQQSSLSWRTPRLLSRGARTPDLIARDPAGPERAGWEADRPAAWEPGRASPPPGFNVQPGPVMGRLVRSSPGTAAAVPGRPVDDASRAAGSLIELFDHPSRRDRAARIALGNALDQLGKLAFARGDLATAEACFTAAAAAAPAMPRPLVNRAAVRAARGDHAGAAADTEAALELAPDHVTALVNAARFHIQLGDDGRARSRIDRALSLAPGRASAWAISGILDARAGDLDGARAKVDRALALDPTDRDARDADAQLRHSGR